MSRKSRFILMLVVVALVLLISQSTGTFAQSGGGPLGGGAADESAAPLAAAVPGGPGYYSINAFEFMPYISPAFPGTYPNYYTQSLYNPSTTRDSWYVAPVNLPNGASVKKMVVYYYDNSANYNLWATFYQCPLGSEGCYMVTDPVTSSGTYDGVRSMQTMATLTQASDLSAYSYDVEINLGPDSNVRLVGVRLDYAYQTQLSAVMRP